MIVIKQTLNSTPSETSRYFILLLILTIGLAVFLPRPFGLLMGFFGFVFFLAFIGAIISNSRASRKPRLMKKFALFLLAQGVEQQAILTNKTEKTWLNGKWRGQFFSLTVAYQVEGPKGSVMQELNITVIYIAPRTSFGEREKHSAAEMMRQTNQLVQQSYGHEAINPTIRQEIEAGRMVNSYLLLREFQKLEKGESFSVLYDRKKPLAYYPKNYIGMAAGLSL